MIPFLCRLYLSIYLYYTKQYCHPLPPKKKNTIILLPLSPKQPTIPLSLSVDSTHRSASAAFENCDGFHLLSPLFSRTIQPPSLTLISLLSHVKPHPYKYQKHMVTYILSHSHIYFRPLIQTTSDHHICNESII